MKITPELLQKATGASPADAARLSRHLDDACQVFGITTPVRVAAFLGQIAHESASLFYVREVADGSRYEGRTDLGNTQPGDGRRYRGRGLIQVTGRDNYRRAAERLMRFDAPDFEDFPEALEEPKWAAWSAADWWKAHGCNELADAGDYIGLGRLINRGNARAMREANGEADRVIRWERAKAAIAAAAPEPVPDEPPAPAPEPAQPAPIEPAPAPQPEKPRMAPALLTLVAGLAQSLFAAFTPLAQEKLQKEIGRHTDRPEVAQQIATAAIEAVKTATGKADPIEAVMTAKTDPAVIAKVEASVLEELEKLAPLLERMAVIDRQVFADEEASREAANRRALASAHDQDAYLTQSIVRMVVGILIGGAMLTGFLAWLKVDVQVILGALLALVGAVGGKFQTRYDHRYGSSAGSANKDAVRDAALAQITRKAPTP